MYRRRGERGPKRLREDHSSQYATQMNDDRNWPRSSYGSAAGGGRGRGRSRGHPPWLRGKEIGLYYRSLSLKNKEKQSQKIEKQRIRLDPNRKDEILKLLHSAEEKWCQENVPATKEGLEHRYGNVSESRFKREFLRSVTGSLEKKLAQVASDGIVGGLPRDPALDERLRLQLKHMADASGSLQEFRRSLPAYKLHRQIVDLVATHQVVVLSGETGCGKTTQVAQFLLDEEIAAGRGSTCRIINTQPRRISAISVAQRVAEERGESCGGPDASCGYQIRLEKALPRKQGSLLFCTTGVLLQWMHSDPTLSEVSHIVLDEVHERDTVCDFVMALLKDVLPVRPSLKLVLMSATLNAESFSRYFGNCPCFNIPGFTYPVEELYLEDVLQLTGFELPPPREEKRPWKRHTKQYKQKEHQYDEYRDFIEPYIRKLESEGKYSQKVLQMLKSEGCEELNLDLVCELLRYICNTQSEGAILVFLPGWDNISTLNRIMEQSGSFSTHKYRIIPLHSLMPTAMQRSIFEKPPPGTRKIVISTNIAETSITIDDVVYVIDCGKIKMKNFDLERNLSTLKPEWVSLANARQRRGRAGRVQPGVCYHLYTKAREAVLQQYPLPEMQRSRLEEVILQAKILQLGRVAPFLSRVMDPPDPRVVQLSLDLLQTLAALDADENLTPLGFHLAQLPLDPQTGKMILMAAIFGCVDPVFSVAASLSFKDAFVIPLGREREVDAVKRQLADGSCSDHLMLETAVRRWEMAGSDRWVFCREHFLSGNTLALLTDMKKQFAQHLCDMNFMERPDPKDRVANVNSTNRSLVKAVICSGLYPNIAIVRKVHKSKRSSKVSVLAVTPEDGPVKLHPKSVNEQCAEFASPLLVYHQKLRSSSVYLHDTTMVAPLPVVFFGCGVRFEPQAGEDGVLLLPGDVRFACHRSTADVVQRLREVLDRLLAHKVSHPGPVRWGSKDTEESLLRAIVSLISFEDDEMLGIAEEFCDDDDMDDDY